MREKLKGHEINALKIKGPIMQKDIVLEGYGSIKVQVFVREDGAMLVHRGELNLLTKASNKAIFKFKRPPTHLSGLPKTIKVLKKKTPDGIEFRVQRYERNWVRNEGMKENMIDEVILFTALDVKLLRRAKEKLMKEFKEEKNA